MDKPPHRLTLADGRTLAYSLYGSEQSSPILYCHASPGSRRELELLGDIQGITTALGACLVAPDRPGFGYSDAHPGHRFRDWPHDVQALMEHLGFERFGILSYARGAPYALACAALLPERATSVGLIGAPYPLYPTRVFKTVGTNQLYWFSARLYARLSPVILKLVPSTCWKLQTRREQMKLSQADKDTLLQPEVQERFFEVVYDEAIRFGTDGLVHEVGLWWQPWGFELDQIPQKVHLWHGQLDRNVPLQHARHLAARLPRSELHILAGEGHISLYYRYIEEILSVLLIESQQPHEQPSRHSPSNHPNG